MARIKYTYNPKTCKYEPWYLRGKALQDQVAIFIGLSILAAFGFYAVFTKQYDSLDELLLRQQNLTLKAKWQILEDRMHQSFSELNELIEKDDKNYRVILDVDPLSKEIREGGVGGTERFDADEIKDFPGLIYDYTILEKLKRRQPRGKGSRLSRSTITPVELALENLEEPAVGDANQAHGARMAIDDDGIQLAHGEADLAIEGEIRLFGQAA